MTPPVCSAEVHLTVRLQEDVIVLVGDGEKVSLL